MAVPCYTSEVRSPLLGISLAVFLSAGCGDRLGDTPGEPSATAYGNGQRLNQIQTPATWEDPDDPDSERCTGIPGDRDVHITGLTVTAIDAFDERDSGATGNVYAQDTLDPPVPFSGITIFRPNFSPPALRLTSGDVVDLFGVFTEFIGPGSFKFGSCRTLPEASGTMSRRFEGSTITPAPLEPTALGSYAQARPWLGMYVTLNDVEISCGGTPPCQLEIVIDGVAPGDRPTISNELLDLEQAFPELMASDGTVTLKRLNGIVTYFFDFHIAPVSASDITL